MTVPALPPRLIIAGFVSSVLQRLDWRREARTPTRPSAHTMRLLALLHRGGYVIVPRDPTPKMQKAARFWNVEAWQAMISAWERELEEAEGELRYDDSVSEMQSPG